MEKSKVKDALKKFGIPANLNGYKYLLWLFESHEDLKDCKTMFCYSEIAEHFGICRNNAERSIRSCCVHIVKNNPPELLYELFGNALKKRGDKITLASGQLIHTLIDYLGE